MRTTLLPQGVGSRGTVNLNWLHLEVREWSINSSAFQTQVEGSANSDLLVYLQDEHSPPTCLSGAVYSFP